MTKVAKLAGIFALGAMVALAGCSKEAGVDTAEVHTADDGHDHGDHEGHDHGDHEGHEHAAAPSDNLKPVVLTSGAPAEVQQVAAVRNAETAGQTVTVEGRLKDFVNGKAAFTLVDGSIKSCLEEGDECKTPWDYCCVAPTKLAENQAMVKLVDANGELLEGNLEGVNDLDHLTTVVVTGKAEKDAEGNVTIAANNVYIK